MNPKRRTVALRFSCGLASRELKNARQMLDEAALLAETADDLEIVHSLRSANVTEGVVELVVAIGGYGNVAEGVRKTVQIVDALLAANHGNAPLSLLSAKVRKA